MQITWLESERIWITKPIFRGWEEQLIPGRYGKIFRVEVEDTDTSGVAIGYCEHDGQTDIRTGKPQERWDWDWPLRAVYMPWEIRHSLFDCASGTEVFAYANTIGKAGMFGRDFWQTTIDGVKYRGSTMDTKFPHRTCWLLGFDALVETLNFEKIRDDDKTEKEFCYFCNCFHYVRRTYVGNIQSSRRQYIYTAYNSYPDGTRRSITDIKELWRASAQFVELPPKLRALQQVIQFPRPFLLLNEFIWLEIECICDAEGWTLEQFKAKYWRGDLTRNSSTV